MIKIFLFQETFRSCPWALLGSLTYWIENVTYLRRLRQDNTLNANRRVCEVEECKTPLLYLPLPPGLKERSRSYAARVFENVEILLSYSNHVKNIENYESPSVKLYFKPLVALRHHIKLDTISAGICALLPLSGPLQI